MQPYSDCHTRGGVWEPEESLTLGEEIVLSRITFVAALARLLYSTSVLDQETVCCFLEDQATALQSKKMQSPVMLQRPSESLPQSTFEKPTVDR